MIDKAGMGNRIKQVIDALNITQSEFAKKLRVSPGMISKICSGAAEPSSRTQYDICEKFGVDTNWLETGDGEMFYKESDYDRLMNYFDTLRRGFHDPIYTKFILAVSKCTPKELHTIQKFANLLQEQEETPPESPDAEKEKAPEESPKP